jgi:DeoR/GlpR family transcriptional regulator of sugar metabolism
MLTEERKTLILRALQEDRRVRAGELAARFGVSEDTIRRDLRSLADAGLIRRVYGGAVPPTPVSKTYTGRVGQSVQAKSAIVEAAVKLVQPRQTILLDGGTTVAALAVSLPRDVPLTVVTHSLPAAAALIDKPLVEVVVLGGRLLHEAATMVGAEVVSGYGRCRADLCFLGLASIDAEIGIGVFNYEDAEVKRAMLGAAAEVVALGSAEKVGTTSPFLVGPVSVVDHLITEAAASPEQVARIREAGGRVTLV